VLLRAALKRLPAAKTAAPSPQDPFTAIEEPPPRGVPNPARENKAPF
jgi:hypothetical protein